MTALSDHALDKLRPNGKSRQVRVRVEPVEHEAFRRAARMRGVTLSAWVRMAGREVVERQFANSGTPIPWGD
jgi:hypothetical protein